MTLTERPTTTAGEATTEQRWAALYPRVSTARQKDNWSVKDQLALARLAGVSSGTVTRLEAGKRPPYPSTVRKLATALGVSVLTLTRCGPPARDGS